MKAAASQPLIPGRWLLGALLLLGLAACSSAPPMAPSSEAPTHTTTPKEPEEPKEPEAPPARLSAEQASQVTLHAISLVGTPYQWGGNTPDSGFDCSGLIAYVYKHSAGVVAPRTVSALTQWGQTLSASALRAGDLVVFVQNGVAHHAGIYVGEGRFVHAPSRGGEVRLDLLRSGYWSRQTVSYRRP